MPRDPTVTSRMMVAVRNKNSKAEMLLRRELHARGLRYRLHVRQIIGQPDIVFAKWRVVVFVDGDFWHGNAWRVRGLRELGELFPTRREFWVTKIQRTMDRDRNVTTLLESTDWHVLRFWESDILVDVAAIANAVEAVLRVAGYQPRCDNISTTPR